MTDKTNILLIHAGFGEGHKRAALALQEFFSAPCKDLLDFCHPLLRRIYPALYVLVTNYLPFIWKALYYVTQKGGISFVTRIPIIIFFPFIAYLRKTKPQVIISTHFFPPPLIAFVKNEFDLKLITIVTDLGVHPLWVNECVDLYFTAFKETKNDLISLGVSQEKIISGYVSLREGFLEDLPEDNIRKKFALDLKQCILFMSSIRGRFPLIKEVLPQLIDKFNVFVIYGKNNKLKKYLETFNSPSLHFFSFYEEIWEFISLSSVIITKPGGLTSFEGMYKKKSFIFTHYIHGQEEINMKLLIKYGVARFVEDKDEFIETVNYFAAKSRELKDNYPIEVKDIRFKLKEIIDKTA